VANHNAARDAPVLARIVGTIAATTITVVTTAAAAAAATAVAVVVTAAWPKKVDVFHGDQWAPAVLESQALQYL
jgi:hypothetical protein